MFEVVEAFDPHYLLTIGAEIETRVEDQTMSNLKKKIRDRMARTGETYSTARMHVLGSGEGGSGMPPAPANPSIRRVLAAADDHLILLLPRDRDWLLRLDRGDLPAEEVQAARNFLQMFIEGLDTDGGPI